MTRLVRRLRRAAVDGASADAGNSIIEFIFVAVLVMGPLVYFIATVAEVQRNTLAVTNAAREAGRAFATGTSTPDALLRAAVAARLAEGDEGINASPAVIYVAAGATCASTQIAPQLVAGAVFTICVTNSVQLPGVPSLLAGRGITTV